MVKVLSDTTHTARKAYYCDACDLFTNMTFDQPDVDPEDWETYQNAKKDEYKILPGMKYRKVVYAENGTMFTYRARIDMDDICDKYELYED